LWPDAFRVPRLAASGSAGVCPGRWPGPLAHWRAGRLDLPGHLPTLAGAYPLVSGEMYLRYRIESRSAADLLAGSPEGVGYLLKDRVADVSDFVDAISRVAEGGTVLDPEVVRQLLGASRRASALAALTPWEREVLALVAQGRSNAAIAAAFTISPGVVEKHVASIFAKLGLAPSDNDNRRVLAALKYLEA
jgi:DNA-binding CsgD family transcriptional regulator